MAADRTDIAEIIDKPERLVIDVRSPGEYNHAHIPGAYSIPIFDNEERKHIGTTYKQESREKAIKTGLEYFGKKMKNIVEDVEKLTESKKDFLKPQTTIYVHCWRGGMRSQAIGWLLDLYGYKVATIAGGYKAYRRWGINQLAREYNLNIIGGYTGTGKTAALSQLKHAGCNTIDLEAIAKHKGSAFGAMDGHMQPSQEMFENILAQQLYIEAKNNKPIWLEDESQRIGLINIPHTFWQTMRNGKVYFIDMPFEERLDNIVSEYGKYPTEKIINAIIRMQKRLGGLEAKTAINYLVENNIKECFRVLLYYYDKQYHKALDKRDKKTPIQVIEYSKTNGGIIESLKKVHLNGI